MYLGLMMGMSTDRSSMDCPPCPADGLDVVGGGGVHRRQQEKAVDGKVMELFSNDRIENKNKGRKKSNRISYPSPFPETLSNMFVGFATVPRDEFNELLEVGVPLDPTMTGAEEVLVLYTGEKSLPTDGPGTGLSAEKAVENCHSVKVILQEPRKKRKSEQCIAFVPQWESYSVHKFMRLGTGDALSQGVNYKYPLRYVSRSHSDQGKYVSVPNARLHTQESNSVLVDYLSHYDRVRKDLSDLLRVRMQQSTGPSDSSAFIVMVCNAGQKELLHNFVCNAKAKGLDLSRVIMFATDETTYKLCNELGIAAFYDKAIFGTMPETAARHYGDRSFAKMMMAKVFCVHLVNSLGYDVLFQDVDVIWFQNPLPYFQTPEARDWDMVSRLLFELYLLPASL
jgi:hypothetical protein